jgi:hypothetical protein
MERLSTVVTKIGDVWCDLAHNNASWPVQGHYYCKTCWRKHEVPWALSPTANIEPRLIAEDGNGTTNALGRLSPISTRA